MHFQFRFQKKTQRPAGMELQLQGKLRSEGASSAYIAQLWACMGHHRSAASGIQISSSVQHNTTHTMGTFRFASSTLQQIEKTLGLETSQLQLWWPVGKRLSISPLSYLRAALCLLDPRKWLPFLRSSEAVRTREESCRGFIYASCSCRHAKTMPCMREKNVCRVRTSIVPSCLQVDSIDTDVYLTPQVTTSFACVRVSPSCSLLLSAVGLSTVFFSYNKSV